MSLPAHNKYGGHFDENYHIFSDYKMSNYFKNAYILIKQIQTYIYQPASPIFMPRVKKITEFQKIEGVKKIIRCVCCGKRIVVKNFNQIKCEKCGYRGVRSTSVKA